MANTVYKGEYGNPMPSAKRKKKKQAMALKATNRKKYKSK